MGSGVFGFCVRGTTAREAALVFLTSFSVFFFGALYGAGTSIFVRSGPDGSSGKGARQ